MSGGRGGRGGHSLAGLGAAPRYHPCQETTRAVFAMQRRRPDIPGRGEETAPPLALFVLAVSRPFSACPSRGPGARVARAKCPSCRCRGLSAAWQSWHIARSPAGMFTGQVRHLTSSRAALARWPTARYLAKSCWAIWGSTLGSSPSLTTGGAAAWRASKPGSRRQDAHRAPPVNRQLPIRCTGYTVDASEGFRVSVGR